MALQKVSTAELINTAEKIQEFNNKMTENLKEIQEIINTVIGADWIGDAATKTKEKMDTYNKPIEEYKANLEKYVKFLKDAAQHYEEIEIQIERNTEGTEFH